MIVISVGENKFVKDVYRWELSSHLWVIKTGKEPCSWDKKQAKVWLPIIQGEFPSARIVNNYKAN